MSRTTAAAVVEVLREGTSGGDYNNISCPTLEPYIEIASSWVDDLITCAATKGITFSSGKLELLERVLAAHAYAMSDQPYSARHTLRASGTFQGKTAMYFEATKYGQMAVNLDSAGCLRNAGLKKQIGAVWLGRRPSEQTDVEDRS